MPMCLSSIILLHSLLDLCSFHWDFVTSVWAPSHLFPHFTFLILLILHKSAKGSLPWKSFCTHQIRSGSFVICFYDRISFLWRSYLIIYHHVYLKFPFLVMRIFKIDSLNNFQIHNSVSLTILNAVPYVPRTYLFYK